MALNLQVEHVVSTTAQSVKDQNGNTSSLSISTDKGNVGIGTTGPNTKLTVWTPSAAGVQEGIRINNPVGFAGNGNGSSLVFSQDRSPSENNINATIQGVQEGANTSERAYLAFGTRSGVGPASTVSEKMRISSAGNVGIGTTGPNTKLTVWTPSAAGVQEGIRINNPVGFAGNGNGSSLVFSQDRSPSENNINATIQGVQEGADTSERAYLAFGTRSGVGPADNRFRKNENLKRRQRRHRNDEPAGEA